MIVGHDGPILRIDGNEYALEHPVVEAFELDGLVVVMFDPDSNPKKWGQFPNLVAVGHQGQQIWEAGLPTSDTGDRYYKITSRRPLMALSVKSFDVVLDATTGRIVSQTFTR